MPYKTDMETFGFAAMAERMQEGRALLSVPDFALPGAKVTPKRR